MTRFAIFFALWLLNALAVGQIEITLAALPTFLLCLYNVYRIRSKYVTVTDMFWFVYFIFFVISPMQSLHDGYFSEGSPTLGVHFSDGDIYIGFFITFLFAFVSTATVLIARKFKSRTIEIELNLGVGPIYLIAASTFVCLVAFIVLSGGVANLMAARYNKNADDQSIFSNVVLSLQIILTFLYFSYGKRLRGNAAILSWRAVSLFVAGCLLFAQNPFNSARYYLLQAWSPILFIWLNGKLRSYIFYACCLVGLLVILPVTNLTSRVGLSLAESLPYISLGDDFFHLPFIDVFDMLVFEVGFIREIGLSYGMRTLGALLFFVPRSIWVDKPELLGLQAGYELLKMKASGTDNLSTFFAVEFYADLGIFGVIAFSILFTLLYFFLFIRRRVYINGYALYEFILLSAIPIVVRGPIGANAILIVLELVFLLLVSRLLMRTKQVRYV